MMGNESTNKIKISVLGITQNQIQQGAYALILAEDEGVHRIPVVIGSAEAQSIAAQLQHVSLPRPLVHDLFKAAVHAFGIRVKEVFIYKFERGVFYSELHLVEDDREVVIDSRTSDAIAIAIRTHSPIYTTAEVVKETGFVSEDGEEMIRNEAESEPDISKIPLQRFSKEELQRMLNDCIRKEEYERAAEIKAIIESKQESKNS